MSASDIAIRVENLGKMYRIGREKPRAKSLVDRVGQTIASPFDWLVGQVRGPSEKEIFWALRDVSFEVKRGEVLGVIGRNGAGKSTLLKILSRITEPTEGRADIHGRVGSLLEVGTGMHPELSGRENIYLNGCILGMRKREIDLKFDEIVDFSGIEKFIDTPVKRYSSGMRVRLGFAIAAHLEPEILIIDEVLAVGDAEFQKKCLGKMQDVAGHGRTVLFVSHNMAAIRGLCQRAILMHEGKIRIDGQVKTALDIYSEQSGAEKRNVFLADCHSVGNKTAEVVEVRLKPDIPCTGEPLSIALTVHATEKVSFEAAIAVSSLDDQPILQLYSNHARMVFDVAPGRHMVEISLDYFPLVPGQYSVNTWLGRGEMVYDCKKSASILDVADGLTRHGVTFPRYTHYPVVPFAAWQQRSFS